MILDMKTISFLYLIINAASAAAVAIAWLQGRKHFSSISFWLAGMVLKTAAMLLIFLRGLIPDFMSVVLANMLIMSAILFFYMGLEQFLNKKSAHIHNFILFGIFSAAQIYFTYLYPSIDIRILIIAATGMIYFFQIAWLMLFRVSPDMRKTTYGIGLVFAGYAAGNIARFITIILYPSQSSDFFQSGIYESMIFIIYIILIIFLGYSLVLMVNRRLLGENRDYSEMLEQKNELLTEIGRMAKTGGWEFDVQTGERQWTEQVYRIHEIEGGALPTVEEGMKFFPPEAALILSEAIQRAIDFKEPYDLELPLITAKGNKRWIRSIGKACVSEGKVIKVRGAIQDITERKAVEEQLQSLSDNIPNGIVYQIILDPDGKRRFTYVSAGVERVFGVTQAEALSDPEVIYGMYLKEDLPGLIEAEERALASMDSFFSEARIRKADGKIRWMQAQSSLKKRPDGSIAGDGICIDITDRKAAEEEIQKQLSEKEILLKEVHHRIKNNINAAASMLRISANSAQSEEARSLLLDARSRVVSMAKLYERILLTGDYSSLSVRAYLKEIIAAISELPPVQELPEITLSIEDADLGVKQLFPLGLAVNEFVTNALKYAFPDSKGGKINISLACSGKTITLTVRDNGKGLPEGFDPEKSGGFGLKLAVMLAEQLGGHFTIRSENGTVCVVKFEAK